MTFFETARQSGVFLLLLFFGAAAGVLYDLLSPLRRRSPAPLAAALDILWCLLAALCCALALAQGGEEGLRLYAMLGMLCGAGIYCLGVRQAAKGISRWIKARFPQKETGGDA